MSWSLVAEVLVLLAAGTGATKWMAHEKRPARKEDYGDGDNAWELKQISKARQTALREYYDCLSNGYHALAERSMDAVKELDKRAAKLRKG